MEKRSYVVLIRGPSSARFKPNESIVVNNFPTNSGPANFVFQTRYEERGFDVRVPLGLWVDIRGDAIDVQTAVENFANPARFFALLIGVAANAMVGDLEPEIVYDNTAGIKKRRYFQRFLSAERIPIQSPRVINVDATNAFIRALSKSVEQERLQRAIVQYGLALQHWRFGSEIPSLAHLYMGMETLTKAALRRELDIEGLHQDELLSRWDIPLDKLDSEVRRRILFNNDEKCLRIAKKASDALEHGFLGFADIRELAISVTIPTANYLRKAIFTFSGLDEANQEILLTNPYDRQLGPLAVHRYVWGYLESEHETNDLAAEGQDYPMLEWKTKIKSVKIDEAGNYKVDLNEEFTVRLAEGVSFRPERYEVWDASGFEKGGKGEEEEEIIF